jgi:hypothetical protein
MGRDAPLAAMQCGQPTGGTIRNRSMAVGPKPLNRARDFLQTSKRILKDDAARE